MIQYLEIGKITNTHGVKGEVKVFPLTDDVKRFELLKQVYIERENKLEVYNIERVSYFKGLAIIKLKEINDMDSAKLLKDKLLKIDRKDAVKLPENSYFICDLIGASVYEENGNHLGILKDIIKTGSNDVYMVENVNSKPILIPALKTVVRDISVENKKITVMLPKGLIDDEI